MIEFTVPSMSCGHCVKTVTNVVQRVDPGAHVDIDLPNRHVRIATQRADAEPFRAALTEEGYAPAATA